NHIAVCQLTVKIRLRDRASGRVCATGNGKEVVNCTVTDETCLTNRAVPGDELWNLVDSAISGRRSALRIYRPAGAADGGLRVAPGAAVEIETRPQTRRHAIDFLEGLECGLEEFRGLRIESRDWPAGCRSAAAHARVLRSVARGGCAAL